MKYRVIRAEGKPSDPGGMVVTMERKREIPVKAIFLASVAFFLLAVCLPTPGPETMTGEEQGTKAIASEPVGNIVDSVDSFASGTEDPLAAELIEAALVKQGYFRDDVPLTYEEQDWLHTAADEFGVDYNLMLGLIERETNFRNIPGDDGKSIGYCQIQQKWWGGLMEEIGADDLTDPFDNFRTACAILASHIERYGSVEAALTAYNRGSPGQSKYASGVLANAEKWRSADGNDMY